MDKNIIKGFMGTMLAFVHQIEHGHPRGTTTAFHRQLLDLMVQACMPEEFVEDCSNEGRIIYAEEFTDTGWCPANSNRVGWGQVQLPVFEQEFQTKIWETLPEERKEGWEYNSGHLKLTLEFAACTYHVTTGAWTFVLTAEEEKRSLVNTFQLNARGKFLNYLNIRMGHLLGITEKDSNKRKAMQHAEWLKMTVEPLTKAFEGNKAADCRPFGDAKYCWNLLDESEKNPDEYHFEMVLRDGPYHIIVTDDGIVMENSSSMSNEPKVIDYQDVDKISVQNAASFLALVEARLKDFNAAPTYPTVKGVKAAEKLELPPLGLVPSNRITLETTTPDGTYVSRDVMLMSRREVPFSNCSALTSKFRKKQVQFDQLPAGDHNSLEVREFALAELVADHNLEYEYQAFGLGRLHSYHVLNAAGEKFYTIKSIESVKPELKRFLETLSEFTLEVVPEKTNLFETTWQVTDESRIYCESVTTEILTRISEFGKITHRWLNENRQY